VTGPEPRGATEHLRSGLHDARWSNLDLWLATISLGGRMAMADVAEITSGQHAPTPAEYDLLALAINEWLRDLGPYRLLPYWNDLPA
jgi:hypothetical protein